MLACVSGSTAASGSTDSLATLARAGDPQAVQALLSRFQPLVKSEASRFRMPLQERADLEAIGTACLWRLTKAWDPTRGPYASLAKAGVRNCMLNEQAKQTRSSRYSGERDRPLDEDSLEGVDAAGEALDRLHGDQVAEAADRLVDDPVDVLILAAIKDGTPLSAVARACSLTPQGVAYRRDRLLARLRQELAELAPN